MKRIFAGIVLAALSMPVMAQDEADFRIDQTKLYVTDPAACAALESRGVAAWEDVDFLALSFPGGIQSYEFHCNFFDVKSVKGNDFLFVDAVCEAPGEVYPDTMSISPYTETTIQVVSSYDAMMTASGNYEPAGPTSNPGVTMYTRCDNLSEIPR